MEKKYSDSHRACTGTDPQTPQPEPRVCIFVGLVPVQGPVYRYKGAVFVQFELQGAFRDCGPFITAPTPLRAFFVLEPEEEKSVIAHWELFYSSHALFFVVSFRAFCTGGGTGSRQGDRIAS
uniref:Uncharacterized protein n=1 Tax=Ananas comosus var. bracteatus TaxID=296719 RepID=A0A6V7NGT9_ANACO|nr:unnamed protein product [Ananas comosus var. bracteatus]